MRRRTFALADAMALALFPVQPAVANPSARVTGALLGEHDVRLKPSHHRWQGAKKPRPRDRVRNFSPSRSSRRHEHRPRVRFSGTGNMLASYYGAGEYLNRHTASGETFDPKAMTAAHRTLPFGARLQVCYAACIVVRVNDPGPAAPTGRALDLSLGAARAIGMTGAGVARVRAAILR